MPKKLASIVLAAMLLLSPAAYAADVGSLLVDGVAVPITQNGADIVINPNSAQLSAIIYANPAHTALFDLSDREGVTSVTLTITPSWITAADASVCIVTPFGMVEIYQDNLAALAPSGGECRITLASSGDGRMTLSVIHNGRPADICDHTMPISIGMPYRAASGQDTACALLTRYGADSAPVPRSFYLNGYVYAWVYEPGAFTVTTAQPASFDDTRGKWMDEAVGYMAVRDIIIGMEPGEFWPDFRVTRGQFVTMLMRMLGITADTGDTQQYPDVLPGSYYYDHVLLARALGITAGDHFDPETPIMRQDMFTMAYNAMVACDMIKPAAADLSGFPDHVLIADSALPAMRTLYGAGLVAGGDGLLMPLDTTTRAHAAQFLYNILSREAK